MNKKPSNHKSRYCSISHNDFDLKLYLVGKIFMIRDTNDNGNKIWYLASYALRHICNNRDLFWDIYIKNYEFITAGGEIIWSQEVGKVHFLLQINTTMTLLNVTYTLKCDSNLISLDQLRESSISYYDHPNLMIFKERRTVLGVVSRKKNVFVLETNSIHKAMLVQGRSWLTYCLSTNPKIRLEHCHLGYASNARIVQVSKLVDKIDLRKAISFNESHYFDLKSENEDSDNESAIINKVTENNL